MPKQLSEPIIEAILMLAKKGWKPEAIAVHLGITHTTVYRYMEENKLPRRAYRKFTR